MKLTSVVLLAILPAVLSFGQPQAKPEAGGKGDGIKVHGHWVLEIKNPDGSVASRKEFENSLNPFTGAPLLFSLLDGGATVGPWAVSISVAGVPPSVLSVAQTAAGCSGVLGSGGLCSNSLTLSAAASGLVFQGTTPAATAGGPINSVTTEVFTCAGNISPQSCLAQTGAFPGFVGLTVASPAVNIQVGQNITVTVTINFT